jgi:biotin operon repressor
MADKASDYGTGIWASKQTMADELEVSKQTVITTIKGLVNDGLLVEVGHRRCATGYLVEYAIDLAAVRALPLVKAHAKDRSKGLTGQAALPVKLADPTGQAALPHQSNCLTQTIIEPSLNHTPYPRRGARACRLEFLKTGRCRPSPTCLPQSLRWPASGRLVPTRPRARHSTSTGWGVVTGGLTGLRCGHHGSRPGMTP